MDFFASQDLARRNTRKLVLLLILAVLAMIFAVYALIVAVWAMVEQNKKIPLFAEGLNWNSITSPENLLLIGAVAIVVLLVVMAGSIMKVAELRSGGSGVAEMLGGRRLVSANADLAERRILNVVEEMSLASGVPVPPVYVLDNETSINAFAAGHTIDDAVIGVNRGTIDKLNREELQGVIAHEFSHILNGDMRMSLRMIGLLHGIQALALIGMFLIRIAAYSGHRSSSNSKGGNAGLVMIALGAGLFAIGSIGLLFARMIKASISRQREYLADASAVQFTRSPDGIGGALKMIGMDAKTSRVGAPNAETISHMFFANMMGELHANLFATHPPLVPRIQRIDPQFSGEFEAYARSRAKATSGAKPETPARAKSFEKLRTKFGMMGREIGPLGNAFPIDPAVLIATVGAPTDDDVVYSQMLIGRAPAELLDALRDLFSARCIVFAALLSADFDIRAAQLQVIHQKDGAASLRETERLRAFLDALDSRLRLPIFEIVQGTLTALSANQYRAFQSTVAKLIEADKSISLFEFFLMHHLMVHIERHLGLRRTQRVKFESVAGLEKEIQLIFSIVVRFGHASRDASAAAFEAAAGALRPALQGAQYTGGEASFTQFSEALDQLNLAAPQVKKRVLQALILAIVHDGKITVEEAELFRAIAESLDCPIPPLVATDAGAAVV